MLKNKCNSKLIKNIFTAVLAMILVLWLFQIDWKNLSSRANSGTVFEVLAGTLFIISLQIKNLETKK